MTVLEILKLYSKEKPANRERFAQYLKIGDRALRKEIENLRDQGVPICSNSHASTGEGGYWIAKTIKEYEEFSAEYTSRAIKIINRDKKMREYFNQESQVKMDVYMR